MACASSDGKISILEYKDDGAWELNTITGHSIGVNAVSWAPSATPGSIISPTPLSVQHKRFASGGCDNLVKIWRFFLND